MKESPSRTSPSGLMAAMDPSAPSQAEWFRNPALQAQMLRYRPSGKRLVFHGPFAALSDDGRRKSPFAGHLPRISLEDEPPAVEPLENGDVRFRFFAPHATTVTVRGLGGGFPREPRSLSHTGEGWWEGVVSGIQPGFHYHEYFVDGNRMVNPDANCGYGCFYGINFFDLPSLEDGFWMLRNVPHGEVRMEIYRSSVTGRWKTAWVYCPPGFDARRERLPVLYLQHGVGENETGWIWQGRLNLILDNLLAEGGCERMLVVMNAGYAFREGEDPVFFPGDFDAELMRDCVPHIERVYGARTDKWHRAVAGLSLGSAQAFLTAMKHPDRFGSVGVFSGGFPVKRSGYDFTDYFEDPERVNEDFDLIFVSGGEEEGFETRTNSVIQPLIEQGVRITAHRRPGYHVWDVWRHSLHTFLPLLFKRPSSPEEGASSGPAGQIHMTGGSLAPSGHIHAPDGSLAPAGSTHADDGTNPTGSRPACDPFSLYPLSRNQALTAHPLFFDDVTRELVLATDADGNPAGRYAHRPNACEVQRNGAVSFALFAPNACCVQVAGLGGGFPKGKHELVKGEDGWWRTTRSDIDSGFHYHEYFVDGTRSLNPHAPYGYGCGRVMNFVEVPDKYSAFYLLQNVPHGSVRMNLYTSSVVGDTLNCWVYTPPSYETSPTRRYPVLYLQHGGGESETGWIWHGKIHHILDNLIHDGACREMIVVMNNGHVYREQRESTASGMEESTPISKTGLFPDCLDDVLARDCIPFVEHTYRTLSGPRNRALAGLSMGGAQAQRTVFGHPGTFANLGLFSTHFDAESEPMRRVLADATHVNDMLDVLFLGAGESEPVWEFNRTLAAKLREKGLDVVFFGAPGHHDWHVWRHCAREFVQRLWR